MAALTESIFPIRRSGRDGFVWWFGQIEYVSLDDPEAKPGYRYKVRIIGDHSTDLEVLPTEDLPWAVVMMPVTAPYLPGNIGGATPMLEVGSWVFGFYYDSEMQKPMIIGSIGMMPGSTTVVNYDREITPFLTRIPISKIDPIKDGEPPKENPNGGPNAPWNNSVGVLPTNSVGEYNKKDVKKHISPIKRLEDAIITEEWCQETADRCGPKDVKKTFTGIFEELFNAIGNRAGSVISSSGVNTINNISGELKNLNNTIRKYVNKTAYVIDHFIAKVKGFVKEAITKAIDALIKVIIRPTPEGNILTPITKFFNILLAKVDCVMEDLGERLAQWLSDVLFGYAEEIYKSTACQVDRFVQGVLQQIYNLADLLLFKILDPIQNILAIIQNPLNLLSIIDEKLLKLLGITCSSPTLTCSLYQSVCSDGSRSKNNRDILDDIIDSINNAFPGERDDRKYTCNDAKQGTTKTKTHIDIIGGVRDENDPRLIRNSRESGSSGSGSGSSTSSGIGNIIIDVPNELEVEEGQNVKLVIRRSGVMNRSIDVSYTTREGRNTKDGYDYFGDSDTIGIAAGKDSEDLTITTITNINNVEQTRIFYVDFRLSGDFPSGFRDNRSFTRIVVKKRLSRNGFIPLGNVNPNTDIDRTIREESIPDPEPSRTYIRTYTEEDLPDSDEPSVPDPENPGEILDLSTEDDEDKEESVVSKKGNTRDPERDGYNPLENENETPFPGDSEDDEEEDTTIRENIKDTSNDDPNEPISRVYLSDSNDPNQQEIYVSISTDKKVYNSEEIIIYRIRTKNINFGEIFSYRLIISDPTIIDGSLSGKFVVESENSVVVIALQERDYNLLTNLDFVIEGIGLSHSVLVRNRARPSNNRVPESNIERRPISINPDNIVTDRNGGILEIPLDDSGDSRYTEIPYVSISGGGYGARAIPILGSDGLIEEIRVIDPGLGYVVNQPNDLVGIIDDFTVIRPGFNYNPENPPDIIIDGDFNVAKVVVNEDGFVIGARLLKRDTVYDSMPEVRIVGDGYGAKLVPSLVFVPLDVYRNRLDTGVRIRKGVYIDCP